MAIQIVGSAGFVIGAEGVGQIPQAYRALSEIDRRLVREEVHARLAQYELADGKLTMGVEMLIDSGRA